jgi:hypothetical protein
MGWKIFTAALVYGFYDVVTAILLLLWNHLPRCKAQATSLDNQI